MYRWVEHTAEVELHIEAPSEEAVFADALAAFAELAGDDGGPGAERREILIEDDEHDLLLADWMNELVYLADAEGFLPEELCDLQLAKDGLRASVRGRIGEPRPLVKAVSLHDLTLGPTDGGAWQARLVLDV